MQIVIRTDASIEIGTGHVMRCLTLAVALRQSGATVAFVCRNHPGNLIATIRARGFAVHELPAPRRDSSGAPWVSTADRCEYSKWLGVDQETDAADTLERVDDLSIDSLVVDHYSLDETWERRVRPYVDRIMAIDDLADRVHDCDLLLDQNLGHSIKDYTVRVPAGCQILVGPYYALLRPDFAAKRPYSLARRAKQPRLKRLLISMGGVDKDNATGRVLDALRDCPLRDDCRITVIMGETAPWLSQVRTKAANMSWATEVLVNVNNMAELMAESDLAIGAAGSTSWERCCLGLPAIQTAIAANQQAVSEAMAQQKAAVLMRDVGELQALLETATDWMQEISKAARNICDGEGASRAAALLAQWNRT